MVADRRIGILLVATGLVVVGAGCSSPAESESSVVTVETAPVDETPADTVLVGDTIQVVVSEAPADTVLSESRRLCDAAFLSSVATDALAPAAPARWMIRQDYEDEKWDQYDTGGIIRPDRSWIGPEPRTLACINESRKPEGSYQAGGTAFRRVWTIRLVRWEDGSVFAERLFSGGAPPSMTLCWEGTQCNDYGSQPVEALRDWLDHLMSEASP